MPSLDEHTQAKQPWSIARARQVYNLANWAERYFDIDPHGRLVALHRDQPDIAGVPLEALVREFHSIGLRLPVLVRFQHILRDRVTQLCSAVDGAMRERSYGGRYTPRFIR